MKQCLFILLLFVITVEFASGQVITKQGEKFEYTIKLEQQVYIGTEIEFDLSIDNPNLIYIDSVLFNGTKLKINRNNFLLHCSGEARFEWNAEITLCGTALFGNDTLTYIRFNNIKIDSLEIDLEPIKVIIEQEYGHFYVRFAKITKIYSTPASRWDGFEIEYVIDIECDVNIFIANEIGNNVLELAYFTQPKGTYKIPVDTRYFPIGVYYVYFTTKTGTNMYPVIIRN